MVVDSTGLATLLLLLTVGLQKAPACANQPAHKGPAPCLNAKLLLDEHIS